MAQWNFKTQTLFLYVANGAMTLRAVGKCAIMPVCRVDWGLRDETSANIPCFSFPYSAMNFMAVLGISFLLANSCTTWRGIFKGLSQDRRRADFSKNLRASLFNKFLSNKPNFSRIPISLDSTFKSRKVKSARIKKDILCMCVVNKIPHGRKQPGHAVLHLQIVTHPLYNMGSSLVDEFIWIHNANGTHLCIWHLAFISIWLPSSQVIWVQHGCSTHPCTWGHRDSTCDCDSSLCLTFLGFNHTARIPSPLPLHVAKTGRNHLNEEFTSLPPTGIGERF